MIGSIQHGPTVATYETLAPARILGSATNSTFINREIPSVDDDANVAKESACRYCPLAT